MSPLSHRPSSNDPIDILLVEDNPRDVRLIREAFEMTVTDHETRLRVVTDGDAAVNVLTRSGDGEQPPQPDLVLLDLHLPDRDGVEILETVNDVPQSRRLPVIILTDSDASGDIVRCYDAHANAYLRKPTDLSGFVSVAESLAEFWLVRAQLPSSSR